MARSFNSPQASLLHPSRSSHHPRRTPSPLPLPLPSPRPARHALPPTPFPLRGQHSNTALHFACAYGKASVVCLLLDEGADSHALNASNRLPVYFASENDHGVVSELVISKYRARRSAVQEERKERALALADRAVQLWKRAGLI